MLKSFFFYYNFFLLHNDKATRDIEHYILCRINLFSVLHQRRGTTIKMKFHSFTSFIYSLKIYTGQQLPKIGAYT